MSQGLNPEWNRTPAYVFLLGSFLEPKRVEELTILVNWELALGEEPETVLEQFLDEGLLEYADHDLPLATRMDQFTTAQLREMLREHDLPVSGRKAALITRLIEADAEGMEEATRELSALRCTEDGQVAVETYLLSGSITDAEEPEPNLEERIEHPLTWISERPADEEEAAEAVEPGEEVDMEAVEPSEADVHTAEEHIRRGRSYGQQGDLDQALLEFDQAVELNPQSPDAHFWRGVALERLKDYQRALFAFNQACRLAPDRAKFYVGRGDAYRGLGSWRMAIAQYDMAIERDVGLAIAYHNRGVAYEKLEDYQQALINYDKAVDLKPDSAESYFGRGVAYEHWGAYARAASEFRAVLELSDDEDLLQMARERLEKAEFYS